MLRTQVSSLGFFVKCLKVGTFWVLLTAPSVALADWAPAKPVEFVVMAGATGSAAKAAHALADIVKKRNLAPISFSFLYKDGHSGADGLSYFVKGLDPNHLILISSTSYYAIPVRHPELGVDISQFTPIAGMGHDVFMLWVSTARQDIKDLPSLAQAVRDKKKRTGQDWVMAGFGEDSLDSLLTGYVSASYQLDMKYLPCPSGGEAAKRLIEGKADSAIATPKVQQEHFRAGKSKPVVAFSQRLPERFASVPRFAEAEQKFSIEIPRLIMGPKDMSLEAQAFYVHLFKRVFDTPEWRAYRDENGLHGKFITGPELIDHSLEQMEAHRIMAAVIDAVKSMQQVNAPTRRK